MNEEEILYQIVGVNSEFKKVFPDKITTILKNGITGKSYTDYDFKNHRYLYTFINDNFNIYDRLEEKDKEIEQLRTELNTKDNIINYICQVFENGSFEDGCDCIEIYDYLKQLKGSEK